jgi:hypothetical protein
MAPGAVHELNRVEIASDGTQGWLVRVYRESFGAVCESRAVAEGLLLRASIFLGPYFI